MRPKMILSIGSEDFLALEGWLRENYPKAKYYSTGISATRPQKGSAYYEEYFNMFIGHGNLEISPVKLYGKNFISQAVLGVSNWGREVSATIYIMW